MEVTRRHLVNWGYKVIAAASGRVALAILESGEPVDLLFSDVVMPGGMSGPDLVEAARRLRPGLKVMFTTGYAAEPSEHQGEVVLRKPYGRRDLARAVRSALGGLVLAV
jgi:CheY-like chemotaxis protein